MSKNRPKNSQNTYTAKYFWQKAWNAKKLVIYQFISLPINSILNQILPPIILADVLNRLASHDFTKGQIWDSFGFELVAYIVLITLGTLSWRLIDSFQWKIESQAMKSIAKEVFTKLTSLSIKFHADNFSGSLVSKTNKLMGGYVRAADTTIFSLAPTFFGVLFSIIILAFVAPLFAIILTILSFGYIIVALKLTSKTRKLGALYATTESNQTGILADAIANITAIKSFAGEKYEINRFDEATEKTKQSLLKFGKANQRQMLYFGGMLTGIDALSLVVAVISVMVFNANVGIVFLIFNYSANAAQQLLSFSNNALRNYNRAFGDANDMVDILRLTPSVLDKPEAKELSSPRGAIHINNITFQHSDANKPIFSDFNLSIKPGEKIGLVGQSGSGKTALVRLILRFSDVNKGVITIDGQAINDVTQESLHQRISYVPQEPLLFHRTIKENIAYGQTNIDKEAVIGAAKIANADKFINDLPSGYDTLVGERGIKLSGGQRQRIAIARAIFRNEPILILDEATSALDSESEALIQESLENLMEGKTAIVIAHRLSTIQAMDRIIVMEHGKIVEEGSHTELINLGGTYAKLWSRQSGGFIES